MNNINTLGYKKYITVNNIVLYSKKNNCVTVSFDKNEENFYTCSIEQFMEVNFFPFNFKKDSDDEYPYYFLVRLNHHPNYILNPKHQYTQYSYCFQIVKD